MRTNNFVEEDLKHYWEKRGEGSIKYCNDTFYTVTPIPYYYERRKRLLFYLNELINKEEPLDILYFGCGDGFYSFYIKKCQPQHQIFACDISKTMINRSIDQIKQSDEKITFEVSNGLIPYNKKFDLIICIAVIAHILEENQINNVIQDFRDHLQNEGKIFIFEATAKTPRSGKTWVRRTNEDYIHLFLKNGVELIKKELIFFPFFTKLDKSILKFLRKYLYKGNGLLANKSILYRLVCQIFLHISFIVDRFLIPTEGNTVFIFKKG